MDESFECVVVGGGSAGLSAALVLGRARRRTLLLDAGEQSNLAAAAVGGLLGHDRRPAAELYAAGLEEVARHPSVEIRTRTAARDARAVAVGFELAVGDGRAVRSRALLLAPGMEYRLPSLPGLAERWGGAVFHCPFCHGWEVRDGRLGVLGGGEGAVAKALLLRAWSEDVTLLSDGAELPADGAERLAGAGVKLEPRRLRGLEGSAAPVPVRSADGTELPLDGLLVATTLHQRTPLVAALGLELDPGPMSPEALAVDGIFQTSLPGVFAAGDVCSQSPTVAGAIAAGMKAATGVVHTLTKDPVPLRRARRLSANQNHSH